MRWLRVAKSEAGRPALRIPLLVFLQTSTNCRLGLILLLLGSAIGTTSFTPLMSPSSRTSLPTVLLPASPLAHTVQFALAKETSFNTTQAGTTTATTTNTFTSTIVTDILEEQDIAPVSASNSSLISALHHIEKSSSWVASIAREFARSCIQKLPWLIGPIVENISALI